jgi:hypothetical protein
MHRLIPATALILCAGLAQAQTTQTTPADPPVSDQTGSTKGSAVETVPAAPQAGANSFTESQARSRIERNGYTDVTGLMKDADGIWRGKATKEGKTVDVALDYKGAIIAQ